MWLDDAMNTILADVKAELDACGADPLCWVGRMPGSISTDIICEEGGCGQLTIRLLQANLVDEFPTAADPATDQCGRPMVYFMEVRVMRCYEDTDENGDGADPNVALAGSEAQNKDMLAMLRGIKCQRNDMRIGIQDYQPDGPTGNYVGGAWTFYIAQDY